MHVLLVEDDAMIGRAIREGLTQSNFVVDWLQDGEHAWSLRPLQDAVNQRNPESLQAISNERIPQEVSSLGTAHRFNKPTGSNVKQAAPIYSRCCS